jgi:7-carboxy-7-deazaguanine synthase
MFGTNEIVGAKYFAEELGKERLFVTSMFMTLQGEGPYRGLPAFFIRLAKCNLDCSFCDTFFDDGDWMTFDEIDHKIHTTINDFYKSIGQTTPRWATNENGTKRRMVLVITGGEPMLQDNLGPFLQIQQIKFNNTQIESNGTRIAAGIPPSTTVVISPKCIEKNGEPVKYLTVRDSILERADCLKFVMDATKDSPYAEVPAWAHDWADRTGKEVFVSPMNIYNDVPKKAKALRATGVNRIELEQRSTVDEMISFWEKGLLNMSRNQENHEYAARYCVQHGFILNLQIHLYASLA